MTIHWPAHRDGGSITSPSRSRALRRSVRQALEVLQRLSPARIVPLPRAAMPMSVAVVCVYRARNAGVVREAVAALPPGSPVRLWALDDVADDLRDLTIGVGPGGRTELLNALVRSLPFEPDALVLMDDDIRFVVGAIPRLAHAGATMGFDVFQPAHSRTSHTAFSFVRKRGMLFARETTFVEQGPVVVMSRRAQRALLPLPEELVMGWGIEVRWHCLARGGQLHLGIVDGVVIRHDPSRVGSDHGYDTRPEQARLQRELEAVGLTDIRQLQRTVRDVGPAAAWRDGWAMRGDADRRDAV